MTVTVTQTQTDLEQILALQQRNLIKNISAEERKEQGFVTVEHDLDLLQKMHNAAPSIIIKDDNQVVAYALTMPRECRLMIPLLVPMFDNLDNLQWNGKPLNQYSFYVMGQICVDKAWRGQGLFDMLYQHHKKVYSNQFELLVTEISTRNARSLRAHERVGFRTINVYKDEIDEWTVVAWDWN